MAPNEHNSAPPCQFLVPLPPMRPRNHPRIITGFVTLMVLRSNMDARVDLRLSVNLFLLGQPYHHLWQWTGRESPC